MACVFERYAPKNSPLYVVQAETKAAAFVYFTLDIARKSSRWKRLKRTKKC